MAHLRSFLRSYLVGAGFNTRGMQNIGLTYAMQPGLRAIHTDPRELKAAQKRYARHYQSHPFWTPCLVGILLNVETSIKAGTFPAKMLPKVKDTTAYTLSAIGDSVFAGSLLIFWALLTICLLLSGLNTAALLLGVALLAGLQAFRAYTFTAGVRQGFKFLEKLRRWDLINWGRRVKYANAGLLIWLWTLIWPHPHQWWELPLSVAGLLLFARFVRTGVLSRVLAVAVFVILIDIFPWVEDSIRNGFGL
ncbi:MAG: PTS system mannose/fructose/sorbose family transporter subunit IID [Desulfovibrionaceae bacterium]|nr:PTS system mannose/fructose/sorbose family transporter subunit IID [Desulfovibrionaceae bacterium]